MLKHWEISASHNKDKISASQMFVQQKPFLGVWQACLNFHVNCLPLAFYKLPELRR